MPQLDRLSACPRCEEPLESGDLFCGACGTDVRPAAPPALPATGASPSAARPGAAIDGVPAAPADQGAHVPAETPEPAPAPEAPAIPPLPAQAPHVPPTEGVTSGGGSSAAARPGEQQAGGTAPAPEAPGPPPLPPQVPQVPSPQGRESTAAPEHAPAPESAGTNPAPPADEQPNTATPGIPPLPPHAPTIPVLDGQESANTPEHTSDPASTDTSPGPAPHSEETPNPPDAGTNPAPPDDEQPDTATPETPATGDTTSGPEARHLPGVLPPAQAAHAPAPEGARASQAPEEGSMAAEDGARNPAGESEPGETDGPGGDMAELSAGETYTPTETDFRLPPALVEPEADDDPPAASALAALAAAAPGVPAAETHEQASPQPCTPDPRTADPRALLDDSPGNGNSNATVPRCVACGTGTVGEDGYCEHCGHKQPHARDHWEREMDGLAAASDRGLRHHRNEDFFAVASTTTTDGSPASIAVVCDGVSSATRSDDASAAAAEAASRSLQEVLPRGTHTQQAMHEALIAASEAVNACASEEEKADPQCNAPACTIVAALIADGLLTVGWIGDSRAYWVPEDRTAQAARLTEDDSWAAQMVAAGLMNEAEAYADSRAHAITGWLGADAYELDPHTASFKPDRAGVVVVCTDGLWNYAESAEEMAAALPRDAAAQPLRSARHLVGYALDGGGHDNVTVALVPFPAPTEGAVSA